MRIETRKLFELHGGSAKNEAASGIAFLFCRFAAADAGDTVLVFKHGHVRESDRVLFEMERRGKRTGAWATQTQKQSKHYGRTNFPIHDPA
jgi:Na+-transporting NADH:ubiquinone oxidoreductase subunit NqrB